MTTTHNLTASPEGASPTAGDRPATLQVATPHRNFGAGTPARTFNTPAAYQDGVPRLEPPEIDAIGRLVGDCGPLQVVLLGLGGVGDLDRALGPACVDLTIARLVWERSNGAEAGGAYDPASYFDMARLAAVLEPMDRLVVVPDLLGRLPDPRPLLWALKVILLAGGGRVAITVPDRVTAEIDAETGLLADASQVRGWSAEELRCLLEACGFQVRAVTRSGHLMAVAELDRAGYDRFLADHNLPGTALRYVLLAGEHGACKVTGGIGSYVAELERLGGPAVGVALMTEPQLAPEPGQAAANRWLTPEAFWDPSALEGLDKPDIGLHLLEQIALYYPELATVEFQDYEGLGARVAQARRCGLLPSWLRTVSRSHGTRVYLENALGQWLGTDQLQPMYAEKRSIELADVQSFPTVFLREFYREKGYAIDDARAMLIRYPFGFPAALPPCEYAPIDTVLFFGKRTAMKGYPMFVDGLVDLLDSGESRIRRLVFIGPKHGPHADKDALIERYRDAIEIVEVSLPRADAITLIRQHAPAGLCVLPYQGDNHPVSVLEVVGTGCQLLAAAAGGIPELIPEQFLDSVLCPKDARGIRAGLERALALSGAQRAELIQGLFDAASAEQRRINEANLAWMATASVPLDLPPRAPLPEAEVMVPCFDTDLAYLDDLVAGLNAQVVPPSRVLFVDDGSSAGYADRLQARLAETLRLPFAIVRHGRNLGLPAARNTGLRACEAPVLINLDSDDIPGPWFVKRYVEFFARNPGEYAVSTYLDSFNDGEDWRLERNVRCIYRPLGTGSALAQLDNSFGHANSAFWGSFLRSTGGWDASDNSMWEDWGLYLKIASAGHHVGMIPRSTSLYRSRPGSMARTYSHFKAQNRLARNTLRLPIFDTYRIQALLRHHRHLDDYRKHLEAECTRMAAREAELAGRVAELEGKLAGIGHRIVHKVGERLARYPRIKTATTSAIRTGLKCARIVYRSVKNLACR